MCRYLFQRSTLRKFTFEGRCLVLLGVALLAGGCTSAIRDFDPLSVGKSSALIWGRVVVRFNGYHWTSQCTVCFEPSPLKCYSLPNSGLILMKLSAGPNRLERISCREDAENEYFIKGASFDVKPKFKNFIGDIEIFWNPQKHAMAKTQQVGAYGRIIDPGFNGKLFSMKVNDREQDVLEAFGKDFPKIRPPIPDRKALLKKGF